MHVSQKFTITEKDH